MIKKITMKSVASYDDTGVEIDTEHRLNFLFGYNGSGKSTIARYLYYVSLPEASKDLDFISCSVEGYNPAIEKILVYDESFKNRNFIVQDEQKGIFTLNETNELIDRKISTLRKNLKHLEDIGNTGEEHIRRLQDIEKRQLQRIYDFCWNTKNKFSAFLKADFRFPGNKRKFFEMVSACIAKGGTLRQWDKLSEEYQNLYEKDIHNVNFKVDIKVFTQLLELQEKLTNLLGKVIIGNKDIDIAKLIDRLNIAPWVHVGVALLEKSPDKCPFCQQKINSEKLISLNNQFSKYFDKTYEESLSAIKKLGNDYYYNLKNLSKELKAIMTLFNPELKVSLLDSRLMETWSKNKEIIEEKISNPNEKKSLIKLDYFQTDLIKLNDAIATNNKQFTELDNLRRNWVRDCWIYLANECKEAVEKYNTKTKFIDKCKLWFETEATLRKKKITGLSALIEKLLTQTINTTDAKDKINNLLKSAGFTSFSIEEKGDTESGVSTYFLKRRLRGTRSIYKSLSEGEKTFISFLYFYCLCFGTDNPTAISKKKIIVIDDPVSSLDSQIMFVISILFMKLAKKQTSGVHPNKSMFEESSIEQIFLLTHNFYFYKEITLKQRPLCSDKHFLMIEKHSDITSVHEIDGVMKTDYALLWDSLKKAKDSLEDSDTSNNIFIANTMRRIIDSYVEFIGMYKSGKNTTWTALDKMKAGSEERIVAAALVSLINEESHSMSPLDDVYYDNIIHRAPSLLFEVFEKIFMSIGEDHYKMMMGSSN